MLSVSASARLPIVRSRCSLSMTSRVERVLATAVSARRPSGDDMTDDPNASPCPSAAGGRPPPLSSTVEPSPPTTKNSDAGSPSL